MDLNGDGHVDILSGSYSRMTQDMAGLFQVLWGTEDGGFRKPEALDGTDGEPLIIAPDGNNDVTDKICTRPTAVDLDGDGHLDIVSGNFSGTFYLFRGLGEGRFAPESELLRTANGPLTVPHHSDPFFVDWDGDGDLDMLSGSSSGGVFLIANTGSATGPRFAASTELIAAPRVDPSEVRLGDAHLTGPQTSTRVWADDIDGDGKLDLLVGDSVQLVFAAEGVEDDVALEQYAAWMERQSALFAEFPQDDDDDAWEAWNERQHQLEEERDEIVRLESTGFVWVYHQQ